MKGTILGPDGAPLAGARAESLQDYYRFWNHQPLPTNEFLVEGIGPGESRRLLFAHEEKMNQPNDVAIAPNGTVPGSWLVVIDPSGPGINQGPATDHTTVVAP